MKTEALVPGKAPGFELPAALEAPVVPALRSSAGGLGAVRHQNSGLAPATSSRNWLVDAMQKKVDIGSPSQGRSTPRLPGENALEPGTGSAGEIDPTTGQRISVIEEPSPRQASERARAAAPPTHVTVDNPLDRFMGEWLSPQDYALTRRGQVTGASGEKPVATFEGATGTTLPALGEPVNLGSSAAGFNADARAGGIDSSSPRPPNPYLAVPGSLLPEIGPARISSAPSWSPPLVPGAAPSRAEVAMPAWDIDASQSQRPDPRRADDSKYFPQLKRF